MVFSDVKWWSGFLKYFTENFPRAIYFLRGAIVFSLVTPSVRAGFFNSRVKRYTIESIRIILIEYTAQKRILSEGKALILQHVDYSGVYKCHDIWTFLVLLELEYALFTRYMQKLVSFIFFWSSDPSIKTLKYVSIFLLLIKCQAINIIT